MMLESLHSVATTALEAAHKACGKIAPAWSLDKNIAVNPWWFWRQRPMSQVAAKLRHLHNIQMLMPKQYFQRQWQRGIQADHLNQAALELGVAISVDALVDYLSEPEDPRHWLHLSDWADKQVEQSRKMPWCEEIIYQISQTCALYKTYPEKAHPNDDALSFYGFWLDVVQQDKGLSIVMDEPALAEFFITLPHQPDQVIARFYQELQQSVAIDESAFEDYCLALLLDINGWAAAVAENEWQDQLGLTSSDGKPYQHNRLLHLLAVRMAWEWAIWTVAGNRLMDKRPLRQHFLAQFGQLALREARCYERSRYLWVWQRALEIAYQKSLSQQLLRAPAVRTTAPSLQAIFCIDVRSEPMRRALESVSPEIETKGFAGFFGLPIHYEPIAGKLQRPQLPGLLRASISARPRWKQQAQQAFAPAVSQYRWQKVSDSASANFGLVETKGLLDGLRLVVQSLGFGQGGNALNQFADLDGWELWHKGAPLAQEELVGMLKTILQHMGFRDLFAARILLVAHGSCTANNPFAASLDCGACGGQTGEVNVRVLADVLNQPAVRAALAEQGLVIPAQTRFIACLHNTTTDDIDCLDSADTDSSEPWQAWLRIASERARAARADSLGLPPRKPGALRRLFQGRSQDWAELRPEWGLANNAAFIVAPRQATADINLQGRAFLHDYRWQQDTGFQTLELILTAPMVVTQWINMQYYASMVDTRQYGSGNKLLHNVVGGHLGIFEGNGGDLRIGLPLQSLHDGKDWRHQPVRLSVYVAAPRQHIAEIIERHPQVADLINNDWLYLFQWDISEQRISRYYRSQWQALPTDWSAPVSAEELHA